MAITIKGGTPPAAPRAMGMERNAAADAHARLLKKGTATSKRAEAAAEKLKQKVEATRGQRRSLAGRVKQAFEELDE